MSVRFFDDYDWGNILWWMDAGHMQHTEEQQLDDAMSLSILADANRMAYAATYAREKPEPVTVQQIYNAMAQRELLKSTLELVGLIGYNCVSNNGHDFLPEASPVPSMMGSGEYSDWTGPGALLYVQKCFLRLAADHLR